MLSKLFIQSHKMNHKIFGFAGLGLGFVLLFFPAMIKADSLFLGPNDFIPQDYRSIFHINTAANYLFLSPRSFTENTCFAPVHLPHGARVKSISVFFMDDDSGHVEVEFIKRNIYSNYWTSLCYFISVYDDNIRRIAKVHPIKTIIDNSGCTYSLRARFSFNVGSDIKLFAVKVNYETN